MTAAQKDERYMSRALQLARKGRGQVSPNPLVGAVLVRAGKIIAEGFHRRFGADHAEIDAIKRARGSVRNATLYVTLEPCCHQGKTPPCVNALIEAGIKRVVIGTLDPNPLVNGKGAQTLRAHGIEVVVGVLEQQARRLNEAYLHYTRTGIPFITIKYAQSLDGRIATASGASRWISAEASQRFVHQLRAEHDAIMVGIGTVVADDPQLTVRLVKGRNPVRICLDSQLRIPLNARVFQGEGRTLIITTAGNAQDKIEALQVKECYVLVAQQGLDERLDLRSAMKTLAELGIASILVEGGKEVITSLLRGGLVNRMVVITAPLIIGQGIEGIGDLGITELNQAIRPSSWEIKQLGEDVVFDLRL
jgi:diaminohydroxyphosphoribosylaminopyrimidine deaminase/5-amino-6-(5-phosphoribosylamino)uracil reductase